MNIYPRDFSNQLRKRLAEGLPLDDALRELRSAGALITECVKATKIVRGCDLSEAKGLVRDSTAWADVVARTDAKWAELAEGPDESVEAVAPLDMKEKAVIPASHEEMLRQYPITGLVQGWYFRQREVSAGCFLVEASDAHGRKISRQEIGDPETAMNACIEFARQMGRK